MNGFKVAINCKIIGRFCTGYNAPLRKKIGKITKFMIAAKLSNDLEITAAISPIEEHVIPVINIPNINNPHLIC